MQEKCSAEILCDENGMVVLLGNCIYVALKGGKLNLDLWIAVTRTGRPDVPGTWLTPLISSDFIQTNKERRVERPKKHLRSWLAEASQGEEGERKAKEGRRRKKGIKE